jgi:DNA-binding IscR family transcriptional regulator
MKFNKTVETAFHLLAHLNDKPQRVEDLAIKAGTTKCFADQLVRKLRIAGLLVSKRGPNGGCLKGRQFTAWEVVRVFDSDRPITPDNYGLVYANVKEALQKTILG